MLKLKLFFSSVLLLGILGSCNLDLSYEDEANFDFWQSEKVSLTEKEMKFQDSLSNFGFNVVISKLYIDRQDNESATYLVGISNDSFYVDRSIFFDLIDFREEIVDKLCTQVIEDSLLCYTKMLKVGYYFPNLRDGRYYESYVTDEEFQNIKEYSVPQRMQALGFKVIKDKNGNYKRVALKKKHNE
ncbi:MAG: hypothetical protein KA394_04700 [Fluviicola sp.]|nr:hypothetical protein [Fluviicola sp.]